MIFLILTLGVGCLFILYTIFQRSPPRSRPPVALFFAELGRLLNGLGYRRQVRAVELMSCALGLYYGLFHPAMQMAVEQGQVLAGVVQYPADNAFYLYQIKTWNIWSQIAAIGLRLGLNEIATSAILSALAGILMFLGFALTILAVTHSPSFSLVGTFIACGIFQVLSMAGFSGFTYPIMLVGTEHSYGMLGLNFMLVCVGLLAVEEYSLGFFLLGIAPAAHPSLAVWTGLTALICLLIEPRNIRGWLKCAPFGLLGAGFAAISYFAQRMTFPTITVDPAATQKYLHAYLLYWDLHRAAPISGLFENMIGSLVFAGSVVTSFLVLARNDSLSFGLRLLLRFVLVSVVIAVVFAFWSQVGLPFGDFISVLMPARFLNLTTLCYAALMIGLLHIHRSEVWVTHILALSLPILIILTASSLIPPVLAAVPPIVITCLALLSQVYPKRKALLLGTLLGVPLIAALNGILVGNNALPYVFALVGFGLVGWCCSRVELIAPVATSSYRRVRGPLLSTYATALIAALVMFAGLAIRGAVFSARTTLYDDPFFEQISKRKGLLLISSGWYFQTQLRTRRPLLLEASALDALPYAMEGAPQVANVLSVIYHIDFSNPPLATRHTGTLIALPEVKKLWESRSPHEWQTLAGKYGFTQILVLPGWGLQLPVRTSSPFYGTLYDIP